VIYTWTKDFLSGLQIIIMVFTIAPKIYF
jgi:hypothetical protein